MFPAMWRHESHIEQLQHITASLTSEFAEPFHSAPFFSQYVAES